MKTGKTRAFYIETLVLVLVLLAVMSILIQVYGAAASESLNAKRESAAAVISQNLIAEFQAGSGAFGEPEKQLMEQDTEEAEPVLLNLVRGADGLFSEDGDYSVSVLIVKEDRPVGSMLIMTAMIMYGDDENVLTAVESSRYVADQSAGQTGIILDRADAWTAGEGDLASTAEDAREGADESGTEAGS